MTPSPAPASVIGPPMIARSFPLPAPSVQVTPVLSVSKVAPALCTLNPRGAEVLVNPTCRSVPPLMTIFALLNQAVPKLPPQAQLSNSTVAPELILILREVPDSVPLALIKILPVPVIDKVPLLTSVFPE